jgi:hypothetical protein
VLEDSYEGEMGVVGESHHGKTTTISIRIPDEPFPAHTDIRETTMATVRCPIPGNHPNGTGIAERGLDLDSFTISLKYYYFLAYFPFKKSA